MTPFLSAIYIFPVSPMCLLPSLSVCPLPMPPSIFISVTVSPALVFSSERAFCWALRVCMLKKKKKVETVSTTMNRNIQVWNFTVMETSFLFMEPHFLRFPVMTDSRKADRHIPIPVKIIIGTAQVSTTLKAVLMSSRWVSSTANIWKTSVTLPMKKA